MFNNGKYKLRFFIEWGGGYLWSDVTDEKTFNRFDCGPICNPNEIGVSKELCIELDALAEEYQGSLDWAYPLNPSPWTRKQFKDFFGRLKIAYNKLCNELKDEFDISYEMDDIEELYLG